MRLEERERLGLKVRKLRNERGLSQASLARLAGCSTRYVLDLEAGRVNPRLGDLLDIARALRVTVEALLSQGRRSDVAPDTLEREEATRRREFLALLGAAGAGLVDLERLAAPVADAAWLRDAEIVSVAISDQRSTVAPGILLPVILGHLASLEARLPATEELTAKTALVVALLLAHDGRRGQAHRCYALADALGSTVVRTRALTGQAWLYGGRRALDLQDRAVELLGAGTPRSLVGLLARRGELHAEAHDDLAAMRDLEGAAQAQAMSGESEWHWLDPQDEVELGAYRATVLSALGRNREALDTFDWVLAHMEPSKVLWRQRVAADRDRALAALS